MAKTAAASKSRTAVSSTTSTLPLHDDTVTQIGCYRHKHMVRAGFRSITFVALVGMFCVYNWYSSSDIEGENGKWFVDHPGRHLAEGNYILTFPDEADPAWLMVLLIFGILYMFLALAIICDEFFVPALEAMADEDHLNLSMDIAGATLMAAGGSAPELFTSFIGTFNKSDIGFGTIVGSAVFNVLFVIGMCSLYSKDVLQLTWWPLFRDSSYYTFGLVVLALFVSVISPGEIKSWEAVVLFCMYLGYIVLMFFNRKIYKGLTGKDFVDPEEMVGPGFIAFRAGIVQLLSNPASWAKKLGVGVVSRMAGNVDEVFDKVDADHSGSIDKDELRKCLEDLDYHPSDAELDEIMVNLDKSKDGLIDKEEFKSWYIRSEEHVKKKMRKVFDQFDTNKDGVISRDEIQNLLNLIAPQHISDEDVDTAIEACYESGSKEEITFDEFSHWYINSMIYEKQIAAEDDEEDESFDGTVCESLYPPKDSNCMGYVRWALLIPLYAIMSFTIPDARRPGMEKWCYVAFLISILWIGIFSHFMVNWTEVVGKTLGINTYILGLTFIAAGTSVPDLLSSVAVARKGFGDMAVSSSIGSNIFDILVGLPIPWFFFIVFTDADVVLIGADGVGLSVGILICMLVGIIASVHSQGWKLTKMLGGIMFTFYIAFLVFSVLNYYIFKIGFTN